MLLFAICSFATIQNASILFDVASAEISGAELEKLKTLQEGTLFVLKGHTDSDGDFAYNENLSKRRVKAVQQALIGFGVPAQIIETYHYGETQPLNGNATIFDKRLNRRVEIVYDSNPLQQHQVQQQVFNVSADKETLIESKNQLRFKILPNTFSEDVTIELTEYFNPVDILSANLTTKTTTNDLLETGGMFYFEAKNKNGDIVQPNKSIELDVAALNLQEGYELFEGNRNNQLNVEWTSIGEFENNAIEGEEIMEVEVNNNSLFISELGADDYWNQMSYVELEVDSFEMNYHNCWAQYFRKLCNSLNTPDSSFNLLNYNFEILLINQDDTINYYTNLDTIASEEMNAMIEASVMFVHRRYRNPMTKENMYVRLVHQPYQPMDTSFADGSSFTWVEERAENQLASEIKEVNTVDEQLSKTKTKSASSKHVDAFNNVKKKAIGNKIINYATSVASLNGVGWYNIDRLLKVKPNCTINIVASKSTNIRILLKDYNAYIANYSYLKGSVSVQIPLYEPIQIVATKFVNGKIMMASKEIVAKNAKINDLHFRVYSLEGLKKEILDLTESDKTANR